MENKIYNAIQKGLANVLVFDDNDSTLSYQKSGIDNEIQFPKVSLDELYDIFKKSPEDIFSYDTKNCLSLILANNQEISLHEYISDCAPVFLKISNDILKNSGNEIIIACDNNHYIPAIGLKWQTTYKQILPNEYLTKSRDAKNDFDGYSKCQMIINILGTDPLIGDAPAINYCNLLVSPLSNYKGYLPSIGQMNFILKYLDVINYIFNYIGYEAMDLYGGWWSSSEYSDNCVYGITNSKYSPNTNKIRYNFGKINHVLSVLPLFHLEK